MKVIKNMEAVFVAASVLCTVAAYATAEVPAARLASVANVAVVAAPVALADASVVVVKAKRLSAAEKAALN
jgi:hypothetical protein